MLPSIIRRTSEELRGKAQPAARRQRTLILLLGGVVVLLLVALVAVLGDPPLSHSTTSKSSLLDKSETRQQPNGSPSSSSPLAALPQAEVAPPAPAGAASPTEPPTPTPPVAAPTGPPPSGPTPGGPSKATGPGPQKPNPDAKAVDELLAREYGGQRPVVGAPAKPKVARPDWLKGDVDEEEKAVPSKALGIPTGTEIHARLMKPLDSRTTGSGPAIARLMKPLVLRGAIALPTSTMLYGTAGASGAARFDIHFSRLRLPDGREVAFKAIAYDSEDAKPGLRPSQRIASSGGATRPGLGENLAKGAANVLLGQIPGSDATGQLAKGAGQTVVNQSGSTSSGGGTGEAILLDAPLDFTVFVEDAF